MRVVDLGERRWIRARENATPHPGVQRTRGIASDEMQKAASSLALHTVPEHSRKRFEVSEAHVLEHTDGDERVESAAHVPVVVVDEAHTVSQVLARSPRSCV